MLILAVKFLIIAIVIYGVIRALKNTPPIVVKASFILLLIGLIGIEIYMRACGSRPYFTVTVSFEGALAKIIRVNEITDDHVMFCDSFGVNKLSHGNYKQMERLLNNDGFRSLHQFTNAAIDTIHTQNKKAVMLIGDSYTYGLNADSGCSFASMLENTGKYGVLNAGIPGTDIPQYKAVINEYIFTRGLKPDKIIVCINGANDLMTTPQRKLTPGIPLIFNTNVGGLYSFQGNTRYDTVFADAKSAYENILDNYTTIGVMGEGQLTDFVSQSCLASHIIGLFKKGHFTPLPDRVVDTAYTQTASYIKSMKQQCDSMHVPVLFVLLPGKEFVSGQKAPVLNNVIPIDPHLFTLKDYTEGFDNHPNNSGHKKLADALDKIISEN